MALILRHKTTGEVRRVLDMRDIPPIHHDQWEVTEEVPTTQEEIIRRYGTGLPPQHREAVKDSRRRFG